MNFAQDHSGVLEIISTIAATSAQAQDLIAASRARLGARTRLRAFACCRPNRPSFQRKWTAGRVAVGVKDLIDTADMPTTYGSPVYADHQPSEDAWVVRSPERSLGDNSRQDDHHRICMARTRSDPQSVESQPHAGRFFVRLCGSRRKRIGASGAGRYRTLGSILRPAAYCGVVGLSASFGTISLKGVHPLSQSLDHLGLFARSVDDAAYLLALLAGGPGLLRRRRSRFLLRH